MNVYEYGYTIEHEIGGHILAKTQEEAEAKIQWPARSYLRYVKEVPATEAQKLILADIEIEREISALKTNRRHFKCEHPYGTAEWHRAFDAHRRKSVEPQIEALRAQMMSVLHRLRTLPEDQAKFLLDAYTYKVDGDNGYGSWPNPMKDPEEWY